MKCCFLALVVCLPLRHLHINSPFGNRWHPLTGRVQLHEGVDLHARHDTVFAVLDGIVRQKSSDSRLGIYVALQHGRVETIYGHLSQAFVGDADSVTAGQPIGITGATGRVTGEHLHFAVRYHNQSINPLQFLRLLLR